MNAVLAAARELTGLFIDDGLFAVSIVSWLAALGLVLPVFGVGTVARCVALFLGLGLILAESSIRQARRYARNTFSRGAGEQHRAARLPPR